MRIARSLGAVLLVVAAAACSLNRDDTTTPTRPSIASQATTDDDLPARAGAEPPSATTGGADLGATGEADRCPLAVTPRAITAADTADGARLVIVAPDGRDELRQQLDAVVSTHNSTAATTDEAGATGGPASTTGISPNSRSEVGSGVNVGNSVGRGGDLEGGTEGRTGFESPTERTSAAWITTASRARIEPTSDGLAIVFTADDQAKADMLRAEVRDRAAELTRVCAGTGTDAGQGRTHDMHGGGTMHGDPPGGASSSGTTTTPPPPPSRPR